MDKITYNLVFNRKNQLNDRGMALVQVEAYHDRKKKYFTTKIYLKPDQWNAKKRVVKNHPNHEALNRKLYEFVSEIERMELLLWQHQQVVSLELLKESLKYCDTFSFTSFFKKEILNASFKESTRQNHRGTFAILADFKRDVSFSDLTFEFILEFEHYLLAKGYHINTIAKHMRHLKRHVNMAINKRYIDAKDYAFRNYKIKTKEGHREHLTPDELLKLEKLTLNSTNKNLRQSLDAFLFCCYTGLRYSDFVNIRQENMMIVNSEVWLIFESVKTSTEIRLPLYLLFNGKCLKILQHQKGQLSQFFKIKSNSHVNKDLIRLCKLAGINKKISFHTARHTNATLLIYSGAHITTVQKLLGHKDVKTTQIYSSVMDMTVVKDLEGLGV